MFVHEHALCETPDIGEGSRVWAFAHVMDGAVIGRDTNVGDHAFIESGVIIGDRVTVKNGAMIWEGVIIEDDVFIGPRVAFTNDRYPRSPRLPEATERYANKENWQVRTAVRRGASIGAGAVIMCGLTIGRDASVGAGAIVTRDVPDHALVLGQPARRKGWVCVCGLPLGSMLECLECRRGYSLADHGLQEADSANSVD